MTISLRITTPYLLPHVFSPEECKDIIALGNDTDGPSWWNGVDDPASRRATSSTISRESRTNWIHERLHHACMLVNEQYYQFHVDSLGDQIMFARYDVGDHFDWHIDLGEGAIGCRKISIAVLLTDPTNFTGGAWQFLYYPTAVENVSQGTAAIFPSYLPHRVTPVISGARCSLVGWIEGSQFT